MLNEQYNKNEMEKSCMTACDKQLEEWFFMHLRAILSDINMKIITALVYFLYILVHRI